MDTKFIIMPDHDEMMRRLIGVSDEPHTVQKLYPRICQMAGTEKIASGVVLALALAIQDYSEGMAPGVENIVMRRIPKYLEALIDDEDVRCEAIEEYQAAASVRG